MLAGPLRASETPARVFGVTTALYRRYRPETFEDVIGQEHVTEPLMTALRKNRVNHAYLFSGPRGCGKTTSARILARCLNCAEGPTATPCGRCESCRDLARDGAGSLDVIEMDAASHGGVDHARDLRERATFAPVRDRYKIFIIDEAHMVTREGFNALLKIVEEPPEHVKFIFATTEPSKVLTTIRSRTHHYPFRLVPPEPLMRYLEQLCQEEGVSTEPGVLSLVVRAGGGSVRDSLSVLDQLMAGSDERGISYDLAVALLGYTHAALLDDVVDAFAAGDAATVFSSVDRVVQTGQDPRRFVEDLLERFRDLVVVNAVPDSAANILHGMPTDQINRLRNQATQLGAAELSRSADITNEALNEMTGATSPQLHLELLCARILLPSADDTTRGITSRVDRLERRLSIPRGAGIRQGTGHTASSSAGTAAPEAAAPEPAAAAPPPTVTAVPGTSSPVVEQPRREEQDGPSLPVAPDGSAPAGAGGNGSAEGRLAEQTPDAQEPTDPQDESEETEGSAHPAAGEPVPEQARGPQAQHPPADGTVDVSQPSSRSGSGAQEGPSRPAQPHALAAPSDSGSGPGTARPQDDAPATPSTGAPASDRSTSSTSAPGGASTTDDVSERTAPREAAPQPPQVPDEQSAPSDVTSGELELLRSSWPEIVSALAEIRRVAWAITVRGTPISYENGTLRIAFEGDGDILNFPRFEADVRTAIQTVVGLDCAVEAVRPGDTQGRSRSQEPGGPGPRPTTAPGGSNGSPNRPNGQSPSGTQGSSRGRGPSGGVPAARAPTGGGSRDQPDYFREPEGFGVNRRRSPQNRDTAPSRTATAPAEDDEPVTSWSVAAIPQPGSTTTPSTGPGATSDAPDVAHAADAAAMSGPPGGEDSTSERPRREHGGPERSAAIMPNAVGSEPSDHGDPTDPPAVAAQPDVPGSPAGELAEGESAEAVTEDPGLAAPGTSVPGPMSSAPPSSQSESSQRSGGWSQPGGSAATGASSRTGQPVDSSSSGFPHQSSPQSSRGTDRHADRGPEYWSPDETPPPPEDEPPADMYDAPLSRTRPVPHRGTSAADQAAAPGSGAQVSASTGVGGAGSGSGAGPSPRPGMNDAPGTGEGSDSDSRSPGATGIGRGTGPSNGNGNGNQGGDTASAGSQVRPPGSRPSWRERHAAAIAAAGGTNPGAADHHGRQRGEGSGSGVEDENFVPGADDESLEDSSLYGRAAIERILGGMLIDERAHDANQ